MYGGQKVIYIPVLVNCCTEIPIYYRYTQASRFSERAVCLVTNESIALMIPIREVLPNGIYWLHRAIFCFLTSAPFIITRDPIYFVSRCLHSVLPFESPPTARATAPLLAQSLTVVHPYGILTDLSSDLVLIYVQGLQLS